MKRYIIILVFIILLSGCGSSSVEVAVRSGVPTPRPTTSQGTPISEEWEIPKVVMHDTPDSTCFSSIGYDSSTGTLMVVFRDSGAKYAYGEVPKTVYNELRDAESMGGYYNKNIKGKYDCTKVE